MSECKKCGIPINGFWELCEECEESATCEDCGRWLIGGETIICHDCLENWQYSVDNEP